jgi:hypothetical protein
MSERRRILFMPSNNSQKKSYFLYDLCVLLIISAVIGLSENQSGSRSQSRTALTASRKVFATKKIAIAIAVAILAIAAIWYTWRISSSLSELDADWWFKASELMIVLSAILVGLGLLGEWWDSESWKKRWIYKAAKLALVFGVWVEVLADGGIFETGQRLECFHSQEITRHLSPVT